MLDAVTTARKARSLMRQNRILAMIYNMFAIRIAVIALVTPLIAAILSGDDFPNCNDPQISARLAIPLLRIAGTRRGR
jgi:hypothetical protein